ncbi:hypothetical protein BCV71DRAFT_285262 [Rhizopus microsporus]|uniref:Uncharacterized protein n=1 Tax=Rhizopus microsporus TaxID=58291 RepID=A0A1X0S2N9_RHIZD|nr:hypothetical protein BCV71DRAFT_285262 [Rhizopus microsporus]
MDDTIASIPERPLIISWSIFSFRAFISTALRTIRNGLFSSRRTVQATLQLIPEIGCLIFGPHDDLSTLGSHVSAPDRFDNASFWVPSCTHWPIPDPTRKSNTVPIPVVNVSLGQLWFLWHKDYDLPTQPRHPPLALPGLVLLRTQYWQTFCSLTIPPMAFTPWFCLLHGYIPTAALQHA